MSAPGDVTVKVTVESLGKTVWQKEYSALSGSPDIGLDFDIKINADVEIIGELVRKQEVLVEALKELLSGKTIEGLRGRTGLMDLCVTGEDVRAGLEAIAVVEQPQSVSNFLADRAPLFRINCGGSNVVAVESDSKFLGEPRTAVPSALQLIGHMHEPDADGWIEWNEGCFGFGECPVPDDTLVEVKFECGDSNRFFTASFWDWSHGDDTGYDIVAYRVLPKEAAK